MNFETINQKRFVQLAGQLGVERIGTHRTGSSYLLPGGGLVAERKDGEVWTYHLFSD